MVGDHAGVELTLVEVDVKVVGVSEQRVDFRVFGFVGEIPDDREQEPVLVVGPAALLGGGLDHLGRRAPSLLGRLTQVARSQFRAGLAQQSASDVLVRFGGCAHCRLAFAAIIAHAG